LLNFDGYFGFLTEIPKCEIERLVELDPLQEADQTKTRLVCAIFPFANGLKMILMVLGSLGVFFFFFSESLALKKKIETLKTHPPMVMLAWQAKSGGVSLWK
jgi:hypothetical protein